jgi:hypothetical protein
MSTLSIFADESGDFGEYDYHSPYYIVTLVLHDQSVDIAEHIKKLNESIKPHDTPDRAIHTGPLIRREDDYENFSREILQKLFNCIFNFAKRIDIQYKTFMVEKREHESLLDVIAKLSKDISFFLNDHIEYFLGFDEVILYYDSGQGEVTRLLVTVFNALFGNFTFRPAKPSDYKLSQVADLICTLKLLSLKREAKSLSKSELRFFSSSEQLKKTYLRAMERKQLK